LVSATGAGFWITFKILSEMEVFNLGMRRIQMIQFFQHPSNKKIFKGAVIVLGILLAIFYFWQGITSAYKLYPGLPGYQVQAFDATPHWAGARALMLTGTSTYSSEASAIIQTQYFGRPLQPSDKEYSGDLHSFSYPLHFALLYLPFSMVDFSTALVILVFSFYVAWAVSILLWLKYLGFKNTEFKFLVFFAFFALPEVYGGFQNREPVFWVFLLLAAAVSLLRRGTILSDLGVGFLLAWSTIKPQNSILVILYIVVVVYLFHRGFRESLWFLLVFFGTGLALLVLTWAILPGWVFDFLNALRDYRNYAGSTGLESVFGVNSIGATVVSTFAVLLWFVMIVFTNKRHTDQEVQNFVLAYSMTLQVLIFPTHLYNYVFVIPLVLIAFKWVWSKRNKRLDILTLVAIVSLFLTLYFAYLSWLAIFSEGLGGTIGNLISAVRRMLPGGVYWFTISALILGAVLFVGWIRDSRVEQEL
jgi:hypothetical protein